MSTLAGYRIKCPWCEGIVEVEANQINCKIFRHGIYKQTGQQINQHLPKTECDRLAGEKLIWGCGKPFHFNGEEVKVCGYI